jgi:hypothetical protein
LLRKNWPPAAVEGPVLLKTNRTVTMPVLVQSLRVVAVTP